MISFQLKFGDRLLLASTFLVIFHASAMGGYYKCCHTERISWFSDEQWNETKCDQKYNYIKGTERVRSSDFESVKRICTQLNFTGARKHTKIGGKGDILEFSDETESLKEAVGHVNDLLQVNASANSLATCSFDGRDRMNVEMNERGPLDDTMEGLGFRYYSGKDALFKAELSKLRNNPADLLLREKFKKRIHQQLLTDLKKYRANVSKVYCLDPINRSARAEKTEKTEKKVKNLTDRKGKKIGNGGVEWAHYDFHNDSMKSLQDFEDEGKRIAAIHSFLDELLPQLKNESRRAIEEALDLEHFEVIEMYNIWILASEHYFQRPLAFLGRKGKLVYDGDDVSGKPLLSLGHTFSVPVPMKEAKDQEKVNLRVGFISAVADEIPIYFNPEMRKNDYVIFKTWETIHVSPILSQAKSKNRESFELRCFLLREKKK